MTGLAFRSKDESEPVFDDTICSSQDVKSRITLRDKLTSLCKTDVLDLSGLAYNSNLLNHILHRQLVGVALHACMA